MRERFYTPQAQEALEYWLSTGGDFEVLGGGHLEMSAHNASWGRVLLASSSRRSRVLLGVPG